MFEHRSTVGLWCNRFFTAAIGTGLESRKRPDPCVVSKESRRGIRAIAAQKACPAVLGATSLRFR
jgi:hypothetical protein